MKSLLLLFMYFTHYILFAQIAIGNINPNEFAQLDVTSINKGVLIPRVSLQNPDSSLPLTNNPNDLPISLLVFNTNSTTDLNQGYYYWDRNQWNKLITQEDGGVGPPITITNSLSSSNNTLTSNVNGNIATAPAVNSVSNALTGSNLTTTVNGIAGASVDLSALPISGTITGTLFNTTLADNAVGTTKITNNAVTPAKIAPVIDGQVLTTVGTATTWVAPAVVSTTVSNTLAAATADGYPLTTTVNGVTATAVNIPEPCNLAGGTTKASTNTQNIYQMGRVGINTNNPLTTLHVDGTFTTGETVVAVSGTSVTLPNAGEITLNGGTANFTLLPPTATAAAGQRIIIYNNTNYKATFGDAELYAKQAIEFIYASSGWRSTSPITSVSKMYVGQARIPPHANVASGAVADWNNFGGSAATYATADWRIFSKTSTSSSTTDASKMALVYEYTGAPFDLARLYPIITPGNDQNHPDTFVATFIKIENTGTPSRTRLTVAVTRSDKMGVGWNWSGTFLLNILLVNTL